MYIISKENHSSIAVCRNPYNAICWLWDNEWLDVMSDCYIAEKESFVSLYERIGIPPEELRVHVHLVKNYFKKMNLKEFFKEMERFGFHFQKIEDIDYR